MAEFGVSERFYGFYDIEAFGKAGRSRLSMHQIIVIAFLVSVPRRDRCILRPVIVMTDTQRE